MENNRRIAELKLKTIIAQEYVQERLHKPELYRQQRQRQTLHRPASNTQERWKELAARIHTGDFSW